jgi:hypothetical protein
VIGPYPLDSIITGDARELSRAIPDASVDLIFTDPPYPREHLPLYGWLADTAARVLKPGGFLLAMCGGLYLNEIFRQMDASGLTFFWQYQLELTGATGGVVWVNGNGAVPIINRCKPLLAYSRGPSFPRWATIGLFKGTGSDKRYHAWGQDEASTRYYVDCFSQVGDTVFDPFCGGGTTPAMCKVLDRRYLAFEIDAAAAVTARARVADTQMPLFDTQPQETQQEMPL